MASEVQTKRFVLTVICPDRKGIVAAVSRFLFEHDCNIIDSTQFGDAGEDRFFQRILFAGGNDVSTTSLEADFAKLAAAFTMEACFYDEPRKSRTLILVSRLGHCIVDLLYRCSIGALPIDVVGVVSNHRDFEQLAAGYRLPYHY